MKIEKTNRLKEVSEKTKDLSLKSSIDKKLGYINNQKVVKK